MESVMQSLGQQLDRGSLSQISRQVGTDEQTAGAAMQVAIPLLLSALAKNASNPEGAQSLHQALAKDHDGTILNEMPAFLNNPQMANGAGILEHVLGNRQQSVQQGLAKQTGLDAGSIGQLLVIAAPLLMGVLGKTQKDQGLHAGSLSDLLRDQQQMAEQSNPTLGSMDP